MNDQQLQALRRDLVAERDSLRKMIEDMPEDFSTDDWDNLDMGTLGDAYQDAERKSRVQQQLEQRIEQLEDTIRQIDEGTYGKGGE